MNVGFTVFARNGVAEFHVRDHGKTDRPPLVMQVEVPGVRLVIMGRIYYRAELRSGLKPSAPELHNRAEDDATLALTVYRQHGLKGLERLEGDFILAIWDEGEQRLVCMRDPTGGYPFFYAELVGGFAAGPHVGPLLDAGASRSLNPEYLADYLMSPGLPMEETEGGRTVYQGVQRVLPGTIVIFHPNSRRVEQRRYWDWLQRRTDPDSDDVTQLAEQFLGLFRSAVRTRLRGRTASHLSGGMDSTSVALIARDCLQGREPLHTLSLIYHRLPLLARERPYLESALEQVGFVPHRVNGDDVLDFDRLGTAPTHDEPCPGLVRSCASAQALAAAAEQAGVATIMTGIGSDDIFDMHPFHLTELLRSGRLRSAWKEASCWAHARNSNVWDQLGRYGVANLMPAIMRMGMRNWMRGGYAAWGQNSEWTIAPWIKQEFARRMDLRGRALVNLRRMYYACRPVGLSVSLCSIRMCQEGFSRLYLAAPHGMMLTHPFFDRRVFCLGLGIKSRITPRPNGQKPILAAAMRGILPESILNRHYKGHFNEAYYTGLSRNLCYLEALVEEASVDDLGFLNKTNLLDCLRRAALGNTGDAGTLLQFESTLSLLLWLKRVRRYGLAV